MSQFQQLSAEVAELRQSRQVPLHAQAVQQPAVVEPAPTSVGTAIAVPAQNVQAPQPRAGPKTGESKKGSTPKMGESGSGYTRLANGKFIKNKRPKARPIQDRQSKNWRARSTTALVQFLKERGIGKDDPKPEDDPRYIELVDDLDNAKLYQEYLRNEDEPLEVQEWRALLASEETSSEVSSKPNRVKGKEPAPKGDPVVVPRAPREKSPNKRKVYYSLRTGYETNPDSQEPKTWASGYNLPLWVDPEVLNKDIKDVMSFFAQYAKADSPSWAEQVESSNLEIRDTKSHTDGVPQAPNLGRIHQSDGSAGLINQSAANASKKA